MRVFDDCQDAIRHAALGGQALLLVRRRRRDGGPPSEPCSASLYDQDLDRLRRTIRRLRLGSVFVLDPGTRRQHVIVPASALDRARRLAGQAELITT